MHSFDANGEYVVFYDAFGFSSLHLPTGKLKTDKEISGKWFTANGGTALPHNERANARVGRLLPALAKRKFSDGYDLKYSKVALLSDGKRAAKAGDKELELIPLDKGATTKVALAAGKKLKPFTLGPRLDPHKKWDSRTFVGTDDSFAHFDNDGTLFGGQLAKGGKVTNPWSVKSGLPQGRVTAIPHASGTFVTAWHPALNRSFCAVVNGDAKTREVETISPATWSGSALVYQPSAGEIVREPINGGSEVERFQLPANAHGPGELMAKGDRIFFIPADRARVIDVVSGAAIDRKLGSNLTEIRATFLEYERRFNELGRVGNLIVDLDCFNKPRFGRQHTPGFEWDDGDLGFLRLVVCGWLVQSLRTENGGAHSLGSYSNPQHLRPIDAKELIRDFEAMDRGNINLLYGLSFLQHPLEEAYGGSFNDDKKVKVTKPMQQDAEHVLLWAMIDQLKSNKRIELAKNAPKWAKQKLTPEIFVKECNSQVETEGWNEAQFAAAWLVLDYFGANALKVFIDWLVLRPSGIARNNMHIISDPVRRMFKQYPETRKPFFAAIEAAKKKARESDQGLFQDIESSLNR
jgi:hypothetical protein